MRIAVPERSLVLLVGPSGAGKSTFARRHFQPTELLSSDAFRAMVADDPNAQDATRAAFEILHLAAARRLERGLLTVVDATNVQEHARSPLVRLAREAHLKPVALVFDLPAELCVARDAARPERRVGRAVIEQQLEDLHRSLPQLAREGLRRVVILSSVAEVDEARVERTPMPSNRRAEHGPFDVIGDVHGCFDELGELLAALGYEVSFGGRWQVSHPEGRRPVFVGDLVDRGPRIADTLELVMDAVEGAQALCVVGNHEAKLLRKLRGHDVTLSHGLARTWAELVARPPEFRERVAAFIEALPTHLELDGGRLVVAHAGLEAHLQGRDSGAVRAFALYGETTGAFDVSGLPVRGDFGRDYRGAAAVVYGHTPRSLVGWVNDTACVDTGCVFGGRLTAVRWPERTFASVAARRRYEAHPGLPAADAR